METQLKNKLFPVFLKLENFNVLIVGGGKVGLEKVSAILKNSPATRVRLVAKTIHPEIEVAANRFDNLSIEQREFSADDLNGIDLVIVAVNDRAISAEIKKEAAQRNILANVADTPEQCDFYLGSIVNKGHLKIAVSTNGLSPTLAKRVREVLEDSFPEEISASIENLHALRQQLRGDFTSKVKQLNALTEVLVQDAATVTANFRNEAAGVGHPDKPFDPFLETILIDDRNKSSRQEHSTFSDEKHPKRKISRRRIWFYIISAPLVLITGYLLYPAIPLESFSPALDYLAGKMDSTFFLYVLAGFTAQMIDGALGMAYGISATTFLLTFGISPAASSASVHASEVFISGASGLMHLKFGNVNTKLFRTLLIPGVLGAILGAYILTSFQHYNYIIRPMVSVYTMILGFVIIFKALKKDSIRRKIKRIFPLAFFGGLLDSIGGGGWGPIVASTLIAKGRHPRYSIGSVNLAEFFIALSSSLTFFTLIGLDHLLVIAGLIVGGVIAAPLAVYFTNKIPARATMILVGVVVIILSLKRIFF